MHYRLSDRFQLQRCFIRGTCTRPMGLACVLALMLVLPAARAWGSGACCLSNGDCMQTTHLQCMALGGAYSGQGSSCEYVSCYGACCLPDGSCSDTVTQITCQQLGGSFRGNGLSCSDIVCSILGACCLGDGGCLPATTFLQCTNIYDGMWMGHGSDCFGPEAVYCRGACCFDEAGCEDDRSLNECTAAGGQFRDFDSLCSASGACAVSDSQAVNAITQRRAFNFVMLNNVDRVFNFSKFDDQDGTRRLRQVLVDIDGHVMLVAVLKNAGDAPLDTSNAVFISEDVAVRFSDNISHLPVELTSIWTPDMPVISAPLQCGNGMLMPGQSCAFASPYYFPGGGNQYDPNPAGKQRFEVNFEDGLRSMSSFLIDDDDESFAIILKVSTLVSSSIQGQGSLVHSPHRAMGTIRVSYEYDLIDTAPLGRCCLTDGSCMQVNEAACMAETAFFAWQQGASCASSSDCDVIGSCCLDDDLCIGNMTEEDCSREAQQLGSAWFSFNAQMSCAAASAAGLCSPPDPGSLGACCLCDGTCSAVVDAADCARFAQAAGYAAFQFHANMSCAEAAAAGVCGDDGGGACCVGALCITSTTQLECEGIPNAVWLPCQSCADAGCESQGGCVLPTGNCTILLQSECAALDGQFIGPDTTCPQRSVPCSGDANGDGRVDVQDLILVLTHWGPSGSYGDLNSDGLTNVHDLIIVISHWGAICDISDG